MVQIMDIRRAAPYKDISVIKYAGKVEQKPKEINVIDSSFTDETCNKENTNFGNNQLGREKEVDLRLEKEPLLHKNNLNGIHNWSQQAYNFPPYPFPIYCPSSKTIINPPPFCSNKNDYFNSSGPIELNTSITDDELQQPINLTSESKNGIQILIDAIYFLDTLQLNNKSIEKYSETSKQVKRTNVFTSGYEPYTDNLLMLANVAVTLIDENLKKNKSSIHDQALAGPAKSQQKENKNRKLKSALGTRSYNKRLSNITSNLKLHLKPKKSVKGPKLRINGVVL